jgi:predicted kinase
MHGPQEKKNVNEAFETYLDEAKRYRALYRKDSTVNPNFRFKRNRKVTEDVELIGLVDELFETIANQSAKVQVALKNKADRSGIDLAFIEAVYHSASNISEQAGFDAVNAYIANWTEMHIHPHLLDPNVPLKHQISKKHRRIDLDQDGDVDEFDKSTPEDISGIEPGIYKKMMRKYAGEKQHSKKHIAYESVDAAFENMLAHPNCGTPNCCGQCETASITEGVNDPSIFKAVFLAGGPGSGKSFIVGKTALTSLGFKVINSDDAFERALAKAGLKTTPEDIYSDKGQEVRRGAVALTGKRMDLAMNGRLGLVIDGTGKDYEKIEKQAKKLRDIGYEVAMIFVNTDLNTAKDRNRARARSLPDAEVEAMWNAVQKNIGKFQNFFSQKMYIIDNSDGSNFEGAVLGTYRKISAWAKQTPDHPKAKEWIKSQTVKEGTTTPQDPDIKSRPGTQPKGYYKGVPKDKKDDRARHFEYHGKKADNDPSAYAPAPGDAEAKTKESKHTKKYRQMYGENTEVFEDATASLKKKADKTGMPIGILRQVYNRGVAAWKTGHRPGTTPSQWGHARVNSFVTKSSGTWGKADSDLAAKVRSEEYGAGEWGTTKLTKKYKKDTPHSSVNEAISADSKIDLQKIIAMYKKTRPGDDRAAAARDRELEAYKMRVSDGMTFAQIAKELNVSIERARQIDAKAHRRFRQITNRLKEETIDEAFENMLNEEAQCALISQADIHELEKFADNLLNDYGIDIEFTRHFGDRMSDERNTPCINVKELKDFFRKVYVNKGMKIKGNRGIEAILKDLQRNLNMPVVIDYKNGEVEVTFKTIMRKKNFTSPNKSISY